MIPKNIYICHKNLEKISQSARNWRTHNPDYETFLFDDELCRQFFLKEFSQEYVDVFNFIKDGPIKADFWRVCVLFKKGGIYVDSDIEPLVPLSEFLNIDRIDFCTCFDYQSSFNPHFIVAKEGDEILKLSIETYLKFYRTNYKYEYMRWSITSIFNNIFKDIDFPERDKTGIYNIDGKIYQFLKEIYPHNGTLGDVYCIYKNLRPFNNRYKNYCYDNHVFHEFKNLPPGSWKETSKNYYIENNILHAELKRIDGSYNKTSIRMFHQTEYGNNNGNFSIENPKIPKGSWINSASDYYINQDNILDVSLFNCQGKIIVNRIFFNQNVDYNNNDGIINTTIDNLNCNLKYENKVIENKVENKVPKILYFNSYDKFKNNLKRIQDDYKDFKIVLFDEKNAENFIKDNFTNLFNIYINTDLNNKILIWKLCNIYKTGGIILTESLQPINNFSLNFLLDQNYFLVDKNNNISDKIMVWEKENIFIQKILEEIEKNNFLSSRNYNNLLTSLPEIKTPENELILCENGYYVVRNNISIFLNINE